MRRRMPSLFACLLAMGWVTGGAWLAVGGEAVGADPALFQKIRTAKVGEATGEFQAIANKAVESLGDPALRRELEKHLAALVADKQASPDARSFACRQLMMMGTAASVPALATLLPDEQLSHMARYALQPMPCPEAGKALRDALATTKGATLVGIVNSVGERRDAEAVSALVKLLKDADAAVALAAARALGKIAGDDAAKALAAARAGASGAMLQTVTDGWLRCADAYLAAGQKDKAKAIYEPLYSDKEPKSVRAAALRGLVAVGGADAIALILKPLQSGDPAMQGVAVSFIRDVPGAEATKAFAAELPKLAPAAQALVLEALATRGDRAATPAVVAATSHQDERVRIAALQALAGLGDAAVVPLLVKAAAGDKAPEADAARASLNVLKGDGVNAAILAELKRADAKGRAELIKTLAARRAEDTVPELLRCAEDEDEGVRREAFTAIGKLANDKTFPALVALLVRAKGDEALKAAERAVLTVARDLKDEAGRADALVAALAKATPAGKAAVLRVLGRFGGDKALAAVRAAVGDADASVQDAALRTLADWPDAAPADDLLKTVRETKNETHRVLALRGYVRMLALPSDRPIEDVLKRYDEAMKLTTRAEEKKQVLAMMAELRHPAVLKALEPYAADAALKAEAEAAIKKVTEAMKAPARVSASHNSDKAGNATDGKADTRWDTGAAMAGGEWFLIELPVEQVVTKVTLDTRGSGGDYPRGYEVYLSRDGKAWGQPVAKGEGKGAVTEIPLKAGFGRFIKIMQTGKSEGLFWSIHELKVETKPTP
ncbi:MAG TPA: HEAT repeat domain-containing protein [Planctomycetota bacterium]|nr:HEAT repeat domain-containing protein [Planctomycetota bacterium]HRR80150.1 HEAT repeat domain-containing protein [Planctomycetota bacterium]